METKTAKILSNLFGFAAVALFLVALIFKSDVLALGSFFIAVLFLFAVTLAIVAIIMGRIHHKRLEEENPVLLYETQLKNIRINLIIWSSIALLYTLYSMSNRFSFFVAIPYLVVVYAAYQYSRVRKKLESYKAPHA